MNTITTATPVGFIGLGIMGKSMARNLVKAGYQVHVFNRSRASVDELAGEGAIASASVAQVAAASQVLGLCLPDTPDVQEVLFGKGGVASAMQPGSVLIDFSTIGAPQTAEFANRLKAQGIDMLDSPVSGGPAGAANGTLSCMIGGDADVLARCMPYFQAVGRTFTHIGDSGAGQLCKSCNQLAVFGTAMAVFEALVLARKSGIDPYKVREALLGGSAQSFALQNHAKRYLDGQFAPGFRTSLMRKDMRLATAAAQSVGSYAPVAALSEQVLNALCNTGRGDLDNASLGLLYEELSGILR